MIVKRTVSLFSLQGPNNGLGFEGGSPFSHLQEALPRDFLRLRQEYPAQRRRGCPLLSPPQTV